MKLRCEKYRKEVESDTPRCEHPGEYCRFRESCMINFLGRESDREARKESGGCAGDEDENG